MSDNIPDPPLAASTSGGIPGIIHPSGTHPADPESCLDILIRPLRRPVKKHGSGFGAPVLADLVFVDTSRVKIKFSDAIMLASALVWDAEL